MKNQIINFITLFATMLLTQRLTYSIPKVYVFYFGVACGVIIWSYVDLINNYINNIEE